MFTPRFADSKVTGLVSYPLNEVAAWVLGNGVVHINEVFTLCTSGPVSTGMGDCSRVRVAFVLVFNQPPMSTQPGHPFVCGYRRNEY